MPSHLAPECDAIISNQAVASFFHEFHILIILLVAICAKSLRSCVPGCGGEYSSPSGYLVSPGFPYRYREGRDCIFQISQPTGTFINLTTVSFELHDWRTRRDCQNCSCDYLEVRDGTSGDSPLIGRFCGNITQIPQSIQSNQSSLWIRYGEPLAQIRLEGLLIFANNKLKISRFKSDSHYNAVSSPGFKLMYEVVEAINGANEPDTSATGTG